MTNLQNQVEELTIKNEIYELLFNVDLKYN